MEKSHVGLGFHTCEICGNEHDTVVLFDQRMGKTLDYKNWLGESGICPDCQVLLNDDRIPFIEAKIINGRPTRQGRICWIKKSVAPEIFTVPCEKGAYLDSEAMDIIQKMAEQISQEQAEESNNDSENT